MAMATKQSSTPSFFNFLKEGLLLPNHNRSLFAAIFGLFIASSSLLLLTNDLAVQPLTNEILLDAKALNSTDPRSPDFAELLKDIQDDTRELMIVGAAYLLFAVVIGSAVRIVVLFAAVATYSGELHTFGALLGKVKAQLKGPVLTLVFVYILESAYIAILAVMTAVLVFLLVKHYFVLFLLGSLPFFAGLIFLVYFSVLCSFSVVVSVAEPGCHGAGAVGRAWRLVKGKKRRAVLFVAVTNALGVVVSPVHTLATACARNSVASGLLLDLVYAILMAAVGLFAVCAITAFYYECKESTEAASTESFT